MTDYQKMECLQGTILFLEDKLKEDIQMPSTVEDMYNYIKTIEVIPQTISYLKRELENLSPNRKFPDDTKLNELPISVRSLNIMASLNIFTAGDFYNANLTYGDLIKIRNCGKKTILELEKIFNYEFSREISEYLF